MQGRADTVIPFFQQFDDGLFIFFSHRMYLFVKKAAPSSD
jgi:hypothetical protein